MHSAEQMTGAQGTRVYVWLPASSLVAGLSFLTRELLRLTGPVTYWSPSTGADYAAVLTFSVGMAGVAATLWLLRSRQGGAPFRARGQTALAITLALAAVAAAMNGTVNALEDGLAMKWLGGVWVVSSLVFELALIISAVLAFRNRERYGLQLGLMLCCLVLGFGVVSFTLTPLAVILFVLSAVSWPGWQRTPLRRQT